MAWNSEFATNAMSALSSQITQRETLAYSAVNRGMIAIQNSDYAQAIREFQVAAAYKPDLADTQIYMGRTYEMMDKTEEAITAYKRASQIDPRHVQSLYNLGVVYAFDLKDAKRAAEAWNRVVQVAPASPQAAEARKLLDEMKQAPAAR